jgi:hypothetical protein
VNVTDAVAVMALSLITPVIVAVPLLAGDVNTAVYVPLL